MSLACLLAVSDELQVPNGYRNESMTVYRTKNKACRTVTLPVALCGCETWSLAVRGQSLRAFENRALRNIFGPKREWGRM
jgi:hypothetical protein